MHRFTRRRGTSALLTSVFVILWAMGFGAAVPAGTVAAQATQTIWPGPSQCGVLGTTTVPAGASIMDVVMYGASGGVGGAANSAQGYGGGGGAGSQVTASYLVSGGQTIAAVVGCAGQSAPQGNGVVATGGGGGAGWSGGGNGGNGYYCAGICGAAIQGSNGSGGGGGGSTGLCLGTSCSSYAQENLDPPSSLLAVAGGGGGGGETMCAGTYGGGGGSGGAGNTTADVAGVGSGPGGGGGGNGGSGGDAGAGGINNNSELTFPLLNETFGAGVTGGDGGSSGGANFGDGAGSGAGGGGVAAGGGASAGTTDCGAGGGGAGGSSWVNAVALSSGFGQQSGSGNGSIVVTFVVTLVVPAAPTATIASPATNQTFALDQTVPTSFSCAEGAGGPGLTSCSDSNGITGGNGRLDTSSLGNHTYTVTATSSDGLTGTASISYTVTQAGTTTVVSSSTNPSTYGQNVTWFATVKPDTPGGPAPTGTVTFSIGGAPVATVNLDSAAGSASFSTAGLAVASGSYAVEASYSGDGTYEGSSGSLGQTVNPSPTTVDLTSSANPSGFGGSVTLTAKVVPTTTGASAPSGSITFASGSTTLGTVSLDGTGTATFTTGSLPAGTSQFTASYGGDGNYLSGSGSLTQVVGMAATSTTVSAPQVYASSVTFTATINVTSGSTTLAYPTGEVTFRDSVDATTLGTVPVTTAGGITSATLTTSQLAAATHTITAYYSGDGNFAGSASSTQYFGLSAPTDVMATAGDGQATVTWNPPSTDGASVQTYTVISNPSGITATVQAPTTTTTVGGLTDGTQYTFTVTATNANGNSPVSQPSDAVTPESNTTAPGAVSDLVATAGNGMATLSWTPASSGGGTGFHYVVTSTPSAVPGQVNGSSTGAVVSGLTNGTPYTFTVQAVNNVGTGPSVTSNAVTPVPFPGLAVPGAATSIKATAGDSQATVQWLAPSTGGAPTSYTVISAPSGITTTVASSVYGAVYGMATVTGLQDGAPYTFTVTATDPAGSGPASASSNAVTPMSPLMAPAAPTNVQAVPGDSQATVSWVAPSNDGGASITGYTVTSYPGGQQTSASGTNVTVTGLADGVSYTFSVTATNSAGTSVASALSNAVTPSNGLTVPGAPTAVSALAGDGQALVFWTPPQNAGNTAITHYVVQSTPGGYTTTTGPGATSAYVTGLQNGVSYTFTVTAENAIGFGPASVASAAITPAAYPGSTVPQPPTGVAATAGIGSATVSWTQTPASEDGGQPITGYLVTSVPGGFTTMAGPSASSVSVSGLSNGVSYTFTVQALNVVGPSVPSAASNAVMIEAFLPGSTAPGVPTGLTAVAGNGSATLTWTAPGNDGGSSITGYVITPSGGAAPITLQGTGTTYTVTGLTNGATYTFQVAAINAVGTGSPATSNAVEPSTSAVGPVVTSINPTSGPALGETLVTVSGSGFVPGSTTVMFGTQQGSQVAVNAAGTSLTVVAPPAAAGTVDVTVTTAAGTTATSPADQFTYTAATTGAVVTRVLQPGWNTLSFPFLLASSSTDGNGEVLLNTMMSDGGASLGAAYSFDNGHWNSRWQWDGERGSQQGHVYVPNVPMNGLWVYITGSSPVTVTMTEAAQSPTAPAPTFGLDSGWNLAGPSALNGQETVQNFLTGTQSGSIGEVLDPNTTQAYPYPQTVTTGYVQNGYGYWLYQNEGQGQTLEGEIYGVHGASGGDH